ncbi:MAG: hypothetical protein HY986_25775 [Candidatus Melainabacteria bacterium]|nr:hypothetical protein [Candidatus Melainabacteria bacterium]
MTDLPLPGRHDLIWNYDPSKPLLGPNSDIDKLLRDGRHSPYPATRSLGKSDKWLGKAAETIQLSSEELLARIIKVLPPAKGETAVSVETIKATREALKRFPRSILCLFYQQQCSILLAPYVTTAAPELKNQKPVGQEIAQSYDEMSGVFSKEHGAIVAENLYSFGRSGKNQHLQKTLAHEAGHALDHMLCDASLTVEFIAAYENDRKLMSAAQRQARQYFMQEGKRGPREAFADLVAALYGTEDNFQDSKIARVFPNCAKLIQAYLPAKD